MAINLDKGVKSGNGTNGTTEAAGDAGAGTPPAQAQATETAMVPARAAQAAMATAAESQAVALVFGGMDLSANPFGLMDMNDADSQLGRMLPLRRIEYCASDDSAGLEAGKITDTMTREQKARIDSVLVALKFTRLCMGKFNPNAPRDDASRKPICSSSNGTNRTGGTGAGVVEVDFKDGSKKDVQVHVNEGQACATCPYQKWPDNQKRPVCSEAYNLLMADMEDGGTPFMLNIWHTGIKPLRVFRNALKAAALKTWRPTDGIPANMRVRFTFSATPEKRYYLPTFTDLQPLDLEEARRLAVGLSPIIEAFNTQDTTEIATTDVISEEELAEGDTATEPEVHQGDPVASRPATTAAPQPATTSATPSPATPPPGSAVGQFGRRK